MYKVLSCLLLIGIIAFSGCGPSKQVTRIDSDTIVDLSGGWNDTDSRDVAEIMIADCLSHVWINNHNKASGEKPVVIVGGIRNKSTEHIPTQTFISAIEKAFVNSGKVGLVSSKSERSEIREERADQSENAAIETIKRMGSEKGADYMMTGEINTIEDSLDDKQIVYYQTDLTLTNIESNEKVWIGKKEIKKYIARKKFKM